MGLHTGEPLLLGGEGYIGMDVHRAALVHDLVASALLHRALGPQLHCVFVDNGLLRHGEAQAVRDRFGRLDQEQTLVDEQQARIEQLKKEEAAGGSSATPAEPNDKP